MWRSSPLNGPHWSPVTHTCPPLELSTLPCGSQQIGLSYVVGLGSRRARSGTPSIIPFLTMLKRHAGVQVPSLSATVISSFGPTDMPLGARRPTAKTSNLLPSLLTLSMQPL